MNLPFTQQQFFEVFVAYNVAVWPAQWLLNCFAVALVALVFVAPERAGRVVSWGLALLWSWLALAYHLAFFWGINPAAPLFAAVSLAAAGAFAWSGVRGLLRFGGSWSMPVLVGLLLVIFAIAVYPAVGFSIGHRYPAFPTFGLPCPTTLYTFGILLMASDLPKAAVIGPLAWAIIGSAAAFGLGVTQDLALLVAVPSALYLLRRGRSPADRSIEG